MEIRASFEDHKKLKKIKTRLKDVPITPDEKVEIPVIMIKSDKGQLIEYMRGLNNIKNYLKYGFNRIIRDCPFRWGRCIGERCSLYYIERDTGDCALVWQLFKKPT